MTTTTHPSVSPTTRTCEFAWCESNHPGHREHNWHDSVPAQVVLNPGEVYVYAVACDGDDHDDEMLVGIRESDDECGGSEAWMSIADAEYLRDILTTAIGYARRSAS